MLAAVLANINRDRKRKHTAFTPEDFMPKRKDSDIPEIPDGIDLFNQAKQLFGDSTS